MPVWDQPNPVTLRASAMLMSRINQRVAEQMGVAQGSLSEDERQYSLLHVVPLSPPCIHNSGPPAGEEEYKLLSWGSLASGTEARFHHCQAQLRRIGRRERSSF